MNNGTVNIIKASAGSGKTYNLARTYIANLLGEPTGNTVTVNGKTYEQFTLRKEQGNHRHLLAITFTNKATNEMKERIINQLYLLSKGGGDYVVDFGIMFVGCQFSDMVLSAKKALCAILFDYDDFNVSTIDAFFQRILRNFARELDRDYNYELQIDQDYATSVAVHDFLLELGSTDSKHAAINKWVKDFIINNIANKKTWNFYGNSDVLKDFAKIIYKEFFRESHNDIINYLSDIGNGVVASKISQFRLKIAEAKVKHQKSFDASIKRYNPFLSNLGLQRSDLKKSVITKFYDGTFEKFSNDETTLRNYASIDDALSKNVVKSAAQYKVTNGADENFRNLMIDTLHHYDMSLFYESILNNIWNLGLLGKIDEKIEQYRKDTNTILIADTNALIGRALESGAYFIYEHVGTQFDNYMIDEFQDTSKKQYSNFVPLLEETMARGKVNLVIGDEKQSIYRFRNSDPSLLRDVIDADFAGRTNTTRLGVNYRSFKSIVDFNNAFFTAMINDYKQNASNLQSLIKTYNNIHQECHKSDHAGLVRVNIVPRDGSDSQTRTSIIKTLPALINSMLERGYKMSDIAILVNMKDHGKEVISQIIKYNEDQEHLKTGKRINVISSESLMLTNSPSVKLIISALRFLEITHYELTEDNDELSKEQLRFLNNRISEQRYYKILHDFLAQMQSSDNLSRAGEVLYSCTSQDVADIKDLKNTERIAKYNAMTQDLMPDKSAQLSNLVNVVDRIISKYLIGNGNSELENSFIMAFVDVVHNFARKHNGGTINEFLKFWDDRAEGFTLGSTSSIDAVNVMTIHKSKGLEFKCVILPFANWELDKMDKVFWIENEQFIKNLSEMEAISGIDADIIPPLVPLGQDRLKKSGLFTLRYEEEYEKCLIDNINKLYVALTRPKEELHVFVCGDKNLNLDEHRYVSDIRNTSHLLLNYLPQITIDGRPMSVSDESLEMYESPSNNDDASTVQDDEEETKKKLHAITYSLGRITDDGGKESHHSEVLPVKDYCVSGNVLPVHVKAQETNSSTIDEGLRMHIIFSMIKSERDFDKALNFAIGNDMFAGNKYWTQERLESLFETIKSTPQFADWFDDSNLIYNERNLSFPLSTQGGTFEHRRPDRIIKRKNGEVIVIDYKFGYRHNNSSMSIHKDQVREYIKLLKQIGETSVMGYVWYTRSGIVVDVD